MPRDVLQRIAFPLTGTLLLLCLIGAAEPLPASSTLHAALRATPERVQAGAPLTVELSLTADEARTVRGISIAYDHIEFAPPSRIQVIAPDGRDIAETLNVATLDASLNVASTKPFLAAMSLENVLELQEPGQYTVLVDVNGAKSETRFTLEAPPIAQGVSITVKQVLPVAVGKAAAFDLIFKNTGSSRVVVPLPREGSSWGYDYPIIRVHAQRPGASGDAIVGHFPAEDFAKHPPKARFVELGPGKTETVRIGCPPMAVAAGEALTVHVHYIGAATNAGLKNVLGSVVSAPLPVIVQK